MEHTKANNVLNFCNDLFFKYTLPVRMQIPCMRATPSCNVLRNQGKGKHRPQSESGPGHHRKEAHHSGCPREG